MRAEPSRPAKDFAIQRAASTEQLTFTLAKIAGGWRLTGD
jgi:hypothetical protein